MKKIKKFNEPLNAGSYNEVVKSFNRESDRAAGILAGSFVEHFLKNLLRGFLAKDAIVDELFDNAFAPLASFSARAKLCFALGLIPKNLLNDLDIIRDIRNHFAHHPADTSFENPEVARLCSHLSLAHLGKEQVADGSRNFNSREVFLFTVSTIVGSMHNTLLIHQERRAAQRGKI
jgi:DNA-binding MltR family transcriptional regulator